MATYATLAKEEGGWLDHRRSDKLTYISSIDDQRHPNAWAEYCILRSLINQGGSAAEKTWNAQWSARALEDEKKANMLQHMSCCGSLVKKLI